MRGVEKWVEHLVTEALQHNRETAWWYLVDQEEGAHIFPGATEVAVGSMHVVAVVEEATEGVLLRERLSVLLRYQWWPGQRMCH
jgi:hypothetical protein